MRLHFGVVDVPYASDRRGKSTGDVAEILEGKYEVMGTFYEQHGDLVADEMAKSARNAAEALMMGAPATLDPFGAATAAIEARFRSFLVGKEMDRLGVAGVPTAASLRGVSHRFKRPYARRASRPSFIDTGLYQSSFKAWVV